VTAAELAATRISGALRDAGADVTVERMDLDGAFVHARLGARRASVDIFWGGEGLVVLVFAGDDDTVSPGSRSFFNPGPEIAGAVLGVVLPCQHQDQDTP
jgi:hypothetical protein